MTESQQTSKIFSSKLCSQMLESANKTVHFLESKLQKFDSYGDDAKDIACYFKSPMMFLAAHKLDSAKKVLNYIKTAFMQEDGDFKNSESEKSCNAAYNEFWTYTNGWIVRAAHQLQMASISLPGYEYLNKYNLWPKPGFLTYNINNNFNVIDVLTVSHLGLMYLEMGYLSTAIEAGHFLFEAIKKQPNLNTGFYLRFDTEGNVITEPYIKKSPLNFVSATEPNQLHFMIGYPAAYLALLYKNTNKSEFLNAAKEYLDFSLSCHESVLGCDFSHKIAWAASVVFECTGDHKYLDIIDKISNYFIEKQTGDMWFTDKIIDSYDQSAEIAYWFLTIVKNIKSSKAICRGFQ